MKVEAAGVAFPEWGILAVVIAGIYDVEIDTFWFTWTLVAAVRIEDSPDAINKLYLVATGFDAELVCA